ncbi:MAG: phosphatidate cytidylyltransferase [Pseudomonadota bacterium]
MDPAHYLLFGIFAILAISTFVGNMLARRQLASGPNPVIKNLNARIKSWWFMITLVVVAFLAGLPGMIILFGLASFASLREFLSLLHTKRSDHLALWVSFFVILPLQYYWIVIDWYGVFSIFMPVYAFVALPIVAVLRGDPNRYMQRVAEVQWALMTCVYCVSHVPALMTLKLSDQSTNPALLIFFLLIVAQGSDVLQYIFGKLLGRRKVAPTLSPSKTWEGLIGGVAGATLLGGSLWWITPFNVPEAMALAFLISMMGFFGGLVMSAIKRDLKVKDWSDMIAGHGGTLDRLDSLVFSAPVFFHVTRYAFTV